MPECARQDEVMLGPVRAAAQVSRAGRGRGDGISPGAGGFWRIVLRRKWRAGMYSYTVALPELAAHGWPR